MKLRLVCDWYGDFPVAVEVVWNHIVVHSVDATLFRQYISRLVEENLEASKGYDYKFPYLRITRKAFPPKTEKEIFRNDSHKNTRHRTIAGL
ncbi:unnamed protein product [marine sediment metagenome]|uniref:Uncharacterized protein n=1 Tax=marine sediment metagenome TaxID=412755 RepID=X1CXS5_9ZZZZ